MMVYVAMSLDVIDQCLPPPIDQMSEEVVFAVKLAFACQHVNPQCRPNMRQVSQGDHPEAFYRFNATKMKTSGMSMSHS
ncbi:hypothetical protein AAG906_011387 [Vitis piasezkii]